MPKRIVVIGSNFAGLTAAVHLKKELPPGHEVVVYSKSSEFLFMPSLIWVPFGLRKKEDITFPLAPIYKDKQIEFKQEEVIEINLQKQQVKSNSGSLEYDYLVLATGPENNFEAIPGFGPYQGYTQSIFGINDALLAKEAFNKFCEDPGPVVIGAVQGAGCFGASYEFLFNFNHQLKKRNIRKQVELTYLTPEPFLGHFGIDGFGNGQKMVEMFFKMENIKSIINVATSRIEKNEIHLNDGRVVPFKYAMLAPAFRGSKSVKDLVEITNQAGFVEVKDTYQTHKYPNVFAAGVAIAVKPPKETPIPCGVPKTGYLSEEMAKVAAHNIVSLINNQPLVSLSPGSIDAKCVLDAGNNGIIMSSDKFFEPRDHAWLIPGPEAHWAKLAFEKFFISTHKRGWI